MSEISQGTKKRALIEVFMEGAKNGFYVGVNQILPAMVLGYTIIEILKITGLVDILSKFFGPIMALFGLPGESITVIISAFFAKAAGAGAAANMFMEGSINAAQATILLMPCMLMGTLVGHYARIVLVAGTNSKYRNIMWAIPIVDSVVAMLFTRVLLGFMGYM